MMRPKRKGITLSLTTVVRIILAIIVCIILLSVVAAGATKVADGGCSISSKILSVFSGLFSDSSMSSPC